ncbi:Ribosome biogenesis protein NOP53 [Lamellibrachia satsuma]|nr:Ribosome biogenesis protein NOP53 [Lamellibrachia satsuma]
MTTKPTETPPASRKRKRVSKNRKKAWAKHSDITDVEEFLEEKRLQERTGGLVAEKADEQLFFIDKQVDEADKPARVKRSEKYNKPLRCHSNLLPDPRIEPGRVQRNFRKENNLKKTCLRKQEQQEQGRVTAMERMSVKQRKETKAKKRKHLHEMRTRKIAKYDLWGDEVTEAQEKPVVQTSATKTLPHLRKHPSKAAAVEVPHPGASYNPTYDDHQDLLKKAADVEIAKEKEELKLTRALDDKFPKKSRASLEDDWMKEMAAGLFEEQEWEEEEEEGDKVKEEAKDEDESTTITGINPPVRRDNEKTEKERRKQKLKKDEERKVRLEKEKKLRNNEIFRLKSIKAQVRDREKILGERASRRTELKAKKLGETVRLGKLKYEEPVLEIKLSDELEGSLRLLKPEGNLLEDRFHSLQKRNIIEPRKRAKIVKKYKRKVFEKKTHREIV